MESIAPANVILHTVREWCYIETLAAGVALVLYGWYILEKMHYMTIWYIWLVFNVLPFFFEIGLLIVNLVNYQKYERIF